ncbi:hypothetical protein PMAYCL1PPCAC_20810, partial [Pristionchus mayeri]
NLFQINRLKCIVCHQQQNRNAMHGFTTDSARRKMWVEAVRSTTEGRRALMLLLSTRNTPYLCASHFSPSDYKETSKRCLRRFAAIPRFDGVMTSGEPLDPIGGAQPMKGMPECPPPPPKSHCSDFTLKVPTPGRNSALLTSRAVKLQKCVVCNQLGNREKMYQFTTNCVKLLSWVNAVRSTAEERISLLKVVNNKAFISFLCPSHFSPSDYIQCANRSILRPDAIPFFDVSDKKILLIMEDAPLFDPIELDKIKKELADIKEEPIDDFVDTKQEQ